MDMLPIITALAERRPVFHSEADFQFALAWGIQRAFPTADVRLEYPTQNAPSSYIDILVKTEGFAFPIELKYKTRKLLTTVNGEQFRLKNHGAQDLGAYDSLKDLCRIESFSAYLNGFKCGYALWLTNDPFYWRQPRNPKAGYAAFTVHHGAMKSGTMSWGDNLRPGTTKGREQALCLNDEYEIQWNVHSDLGVGNGLFRYALIQVNRSHDWN